MRRNRLELKKSLVPSRSMAALLCLKLRATRAGPGRLDRFPRTISGVLPGLLSLPHRGGTKGGRSPTGGPTPMRRGNFHAAAAIGAGCERNDRFRDQVDNTVGKVACAPCACSSIQHFVSFE